MILTLPDPEAPDLCMVIEAEPGRNDIERARNAAAAIRERCGESELTRLLDRLAEQAEWLEAAIPLVS